MAHVSNSRAALFQHTLLTESHVQGDHAAAIQKYTKALSYLADLTAPDASTAQELSGSSQEVAQQLKAVAVPCLLNRAACSLKLQQPREAIMDCHNVLQTDSSNTKALFRKGQAHVAVRVSPCCMPRFSDVVRCTSNRMQQPREAIMERHNTISTDGCNIKAFFREGQVRHT